MTQNLAKGAVSNLGARVLGLLASFLNVYLLGRVLTPNDFGLWVWLFSIFTLITSQDLGFISAMRVRMGRFLSEDNTEKIHIIYCTALLWVILIVVCLTVGIYLYDLLNGESSEEFVYRNIAMICSTCTLIGTVSAQGLLARLQSSIVGTIEGLRALVQIAIYLAAYVFDFTLAMVVYTFFLTALLYVPLVTKVYWRFADFPFRNIAFLTVTHFQKIRSTSVVIFREGALLWVGQLGMTMLINSDVYLAGYFMSDGDVAKVGVVSRFQLLGVGLLAAALLPFCASFVVQIRQVTKLYVLQKIRQAFLMFFVSGLVYISVTSLWGAELILLWSTVEINEPSVFVMSGILFALVLSVTLLQIFLQFTIFAKALVFWFVLAVLVKIALTALLVPTLGYIGVFCASVVSISLFLIVAVSWLFKFGGFEKIAVGN